MANETIPIKDYDQLAQLLHVVVGILVVFVVVMMGGSLGIGFVLAATAAAVKEFWWDEMYEPEIIRGNSIEDFLMYVVGALVGAATIMLRLRW